MNKESLGTLFAIMTAIVSGIAIPMNKLFIVKLDPTVFTALRSLIIGIIFLFLSLWRSNFSFNSFKKVNWKYMLLIALIGGSIAFLLYFNGLKLTTSSRAAFLHKTLTFYVVVFSVLFLKEKISKTHWIALTAMLFGILLIYFTQIKSTEFWQNPSLGDLLVIMATILWAGENIIAKKVLREGETNFVVSFSRMFFGGLILFGVLVLTNKYQTLFNLDIIAWRNIGISTIVLFSYVFFWYWSLKLINASKAATFLLLSPIISLGFGYLLFKEPLPLLQLVGSMMIIIGSYMTIKTKSEFVTGI